MNLLDLKERRVVVVGGTSGIGLGCVRLAAAAGAEVHAGGRSTERHRQAMSELGELADLVGWHEVDIQDPEALEALFGQAAPIDVLVLAATGTRRAVAPFMEMDQEGFERSFGKLWGYTKAIRAGVPHMAADGGIVMVGGAIARKCPPGMIAVSSVGNAIEGFCRALAAEIAPLRVNVVAPGLIETSMFDELPPERRRAMFDDAARGITLGRTGRPDEVAAAILATATNTYMTGTTVDVEGGSLLP